MPYMLLLLALLSSGYLECENKCMAKRHCCELRCENVGSLEHAQCYQRCREDYLYCRKEDC